MYPHRPKAEAFSNVVDVVKRLRDPTDASTERTADDPQVYGIYRSPFDK